MRVLFSWIGFRDLNWINNQLGEKSFADELKKAKESRTGIKKDPISPIFTAYSYLANHKQPLDKLVIFSDINNEILHNGIKKGFKICADQVDIVEVEVPVTDVRNYGYILASAAKQWQYVKAQIKDWRDVDPYFSLSSGTTAMRAFWTVLGHVYCGAKAKFIDVSEDCSNTEVYKIDFNLASFAINEALQKIEQTAFKPIAGNSPEIRKAKRYAEKAARTDLNVLIYGETGTGKELFAKAIHDAGARKEKKFHAINCATFTEDLLAAELFGSVKGAFTGAVDKEGLLEKLNGGTLFLDELEACPLKVQSQLLRVLQPPTGKGLTCRRFSPVGNEDKEIESDVRIIAATNECLGSDCFRTDLFNRISQLRIDLPALRERGEDVGLLARKLFDNFRAQLGGEFFDKKLCDSAIKFIEDRAWLGNVRELQNALTQAIVFSESNDITIDDFDQNLPPRTSCPESGEEGFDLSKGIDLKAVIEKETIRLQKGYVEKALAITNGNKTKAAELLGIKYQTIDNWKKAWEE